MAPVPVSKLTCDGSTFKCTADLVSSLRLMVGFFNWYWHCLSCRSMVMEIGKQSGPSTSTTPRTASDPADSCACDVRRIRNMPTRNVQYTVLRMLLVIIYSVFLWVNTLHTLKLATRLYPIQSKTGLLAKLRVLFIGLVDVQLAG